MSKESFGAICNDFVEKRSQLKCAWCYDLGDEGFTVRLVYEPDDDSFRNDISAKAFIPDRPELTGSVVWVVLDTLATQIGLFKEFGITI